ncbi:hypothetical protein BsWGS_06816 [Bradybaena similaris]
MKSHVLDLLDPCARCHDESCKLVIMFAEPGHLNHSSGWTVASPSCRNSVTCLACLLEVLNSPALSHVHRQMSLDTLKLLVSDSDIALQLLAAHDDMVFHIIDLITGIPGFILLVLSNCYIN